MALKITLMVCIFLNCYVHVDSAESACHFTPRPGPPRATCYCIKENLDELLRTARTINGTVNLFTIANTLTGLTLSGNKFTISDTSLQNFTNIGGLSIHGEDDRRCPESNKAITIQSNALAGLRSLYQIRIEHVERIQGNMNEVMRPLATRVWSITIIKTPFKSMINAISQFGNLTDIEITESDLDEFPTEALRKSASTIKEIDLSKNRITTLRASHLAIFTNLEKLRLNNNQIRSIEANAFASLTKLQHLRLDNNQVPNLSADMFRSNVQLNTLNLNSNPTTGLTRDQFSFLNRTYSLQLP